MSRRFRLGISGSSFMHVIPTEVAQAAFIAAQREPSPKLDQHGNNLMVGFTRDMMRAMARHGVACTECYHSMVWDRDAVLQPIVEESSVPCWSVHAPYGRWMDPSSPDPEIRNSALEAIGDAMKVAVSTGAGIVVAHPGANVEYPVPRDQRIDHSVKTLQTAAEMAAQNGLRLAVEPMPKGEVGNTMDEFLEVVDRVDSPHVGINFDVNHLFPPESIPDKIRRAGSRILSVHISDQDGRECHWLPFEGTLDWAEVLRALEDTGYTGPLIYETHIRGVQTCDEVVSIIVDNYRRLVG